MWINQVPLDVAFCWFAWRASRVPGIDRLVSRYLVTLAFGALMFLLGDVVQVALVIPDPSFERINGGTGQTVPRPPSRNSPSRRGRSTVRSRTPPAGRVPSPSM
jgi:hypothetical protein